MKTISIRDLQKKVKESVDASQSERLVITRRGKPAAILVGIEGSDWETVILETKPQFWRLIEKRRKQPSISLTEMKKKLRSK